MSEESVPKSVNYDFSDCDFFMPSPEYFLPATYILGLATLNFGRNAATWNQYHPYCQ